MFHKTLGWVIPILTIAVAGISFTSGAGTQPLLRRGTRTIGPGFAEKIQIPKAAILRARPIRFQLNALRSKMKPVALATSQQRRLVLNLFDNVSVTAVADRIKGKKGADITWAGRLEGRRPGHAVLLVRKNKLYGNVRVGRKLYMIRPRAGGGQSVTEVDTAKLPDEGPDHLADRIDRSRPDGAGSDSDVGRRHGSHVNELINVMVVYTPQAKEAAESAGSDIEAEIELAVEDTNQTYINSGISLRLILAHTSEVSYTDSGKFGSKGNQIGDLKRLREKSDGKMDGVHRIRNRVYADLVSLWTGIGDHCGLAHRMKSVGVSFEAKAFSVLKRSCGASGLTFAHELGHNMGVHHDRYAVPDDTRNEYYYGYINLDAGWRTIMSYRTKCTDTGKPCGRIPYFSNPRINFDGNATGIAAPSASSADNGRRMKETSETVARFRTLGVNEAGDLFGRVLASGDFDGDGLADLAVSAPREAPGRDPRSGVVFIYRGTQFGLAPWRVLTQKGLGRNEKDDWFGRSLAAGDFNGDGRDDLAVGAPLEKVGNKPQAGWVFVFKGTSTGLRRWHAFGQKDLGKDERRDRFGWALAAGDFNGDGKADLAVGAPGEKPGKGPKSGWVFVFKGRSGRLRPWKAFGQKGLGADEKGDAFGAALAAGDFNGDGKADLAVGAPGEKPGKGPKSGLVFVFKGGSQGPTPWKAFGQKGLGRDEAGDEFGAVVAAGDFNGDGKDDLAVGAPLEKVGNKPQAGRVFVFKGGSQGPAPWKALGQKGLGQDERYDRFGSSLAVGDFNGDGKEDLAVGAPFEKPGRGKQSGWVFVFKGGTQGPAPWKAFG